MRFKFSLASDMESILKHSKAVPVMGTHKCVKLQKSTPKFSGENTPYYDNLFQKHKFEVINLCAHGDFP